MEELYYIKTQGYSGNSILWWRLKNQGYTSDLRFAQTYSKKEADAICKSSRTEKAYLCSKIDGCEEGLFKTFHIDFLPEADINYTTHL